MTQVLDVDGRRHVGTQGIAERICAVRQAKRLDAVVEAADRARNVRAADAVVVGSETAGRRALTHAQAGARD